MGGGEGPAGAETAVVKVRGPGELSPLL